MQTQIMSVITVGLKDAKRESPEKGLYGLLIASFKRNEYKERKRV